MATAFASTRWSASSAGRAKRAPGWFLPVAGGLLFTLFVLVVLTSAVWYYANYGLPDSNGY